MISLREHDLAWYCLYKNSSQKKPLELSLAHFQFLHNRYKKSRSFILPLPYSRAQRNSVSLIDMMRTRMTMMMMIIIMTTLCKTRTSSLVSKSGTSQSANPCPWTGCLACEDNWTPFLVPPSQSRNSVQFVRDQRTPTSLLWASKRYPHSKPFQNRFGTDFEAILVPKMVQKSIKNRSKIDVCMRLRFLIDFL